MHTLTKTNMAASIQTTADTLEGQLVEIATEMQKLELASSTQPQPDNVSVNLDTNAQTIGINATLNATFNSGSTVSMEPVAYL